MGSAALLLAASLSVAMPARAQTPWMPRLQLDNDFYNFWRWHTRRPDEEYTNGLRATLVSHGGSWWGRRFAPGAADCAGAAPGRPCRATSVTIGQDIYTPDLDRAPFQVDGWERERPYHAWLFVAQAAELLAPDSRRTATLALGVTGPPALGEAAQGLAHRVGFADRATGWETQVGFEPGVMAEYRQAVLAARAARQDGQGPGADLVPEIAMSIGNVRTHAEVGGTVRVGWGLSHPWYVPAWRERARFEWWLSAGGRLSWVVRDMSLDGTWRHPARRVDRVPGVAQYEFGAGARAGMLSVAYRATTRSREYRTGPLHHAWGGITVLIQR